MRPLDPEPSASTDSATSATARDGTPTESPGQWEDLREGEKLSEERERRVITSNRKARRNFEIMETLEAGLVLTGTEVKALRAGRATIGEAYVQVSSGEAFIHGMTISPYEMGNRENHEPARVRKLLLKKAQIERLRNPDRAKGTDGGSPGIVLLGAVCQGVDRPGAG